jgi:hypothetical protein
MRGAEEIDRLRALRHVDQRPREKAPATEGGAVRVERRMVFRSTTDIAMDARRQPTARGVGEVVDGKGAFSPHWPLSCL